MKNRLIRTGIRLVILCALIAAVSLTREDSVAHSTASWSDPYYNAVLYCDNSYYGALYLCQSDPGFPTGPTVSSCNFSAYSVYSECISGIEEPLPQMDFCDMARAASDNCNMQYGAEGANPDYLAWMECRLASKIDQCV